MKYINLAQADSYYTLARSANLSWRLINHQILERFTKAVLELSRLAKRQEDETGWREFIYPARRARNIATTVPLPFSNSDLGIAPHIYRLERSLPALRVYGGSDAGALGDAVVSAGHALISLDDAPLLDAILEIIEQGHHITNGLLLPITFYKETVSKFICRKPTARQLKILDRHDVVSVEPLGRLLVIGPLYWYGDHQYVLNSPRASHITVLRWAWHLEQPPISTVLEGSRGATGIKVQPLPPTLRNTFAVDTEEERATVDWQSVSRELTQVDDTDSDPAELVAARPAILAHSYAVLLPEDGDRRVWLLDPHAPPEHRVQGVDVADLELGNVIVLRTSGGGDLIVPIADEILGDAAPMLRELQHRWKTALQVWVDQHQSIRRAAAVLRLRGCRKANPQNLQNWLGERSLRTEDRNDWQVLMTAAALESAAEKIWRAMGRLHSAHSEAGVAIGRRLRDMANTQSLDPVLASGKQIFELAQGGSVTAFRIEAFSPTVVKCAPMRLMVPTRVRDEWLT